MPDAAFAEPRLAQVYDPLDPDRPDLDVYAAIVDELGARTVLDIGCGTGSLAVLLATRGISVTGVDPAAASLDVARTKPGADRVRWIDGDATTLPAMQVDLAMMTGNVAQVFRTDALWSATLAGAYAALRPGGALVFETRDPARQAWLEWDSPETVTTIPGIGAVRCSRQVLAVDGDLVTFRWTIVFSSDGARYDSDSTLRFRTRGDVERSLSDAGFVVSDVREAPDRPGKEMVFVAAKRQP